MPIFLFAISKVLSGQETGRTSGLMRRLSHILSKLNTAVFLNQVFALIISKMFRFSLFLPISVDKCLVSKLVS